MHPSSELCAVSRARALVLSVSQLPPTVAANNETKWRLILRIAGGGDENTQQWRTGVCAWPARAILGLAQAV